MIGKNNTPKIALCISGEPRNSMVSFPYIYESILNPLQGFNVDVFIHSFKVYRAMNLYSPTSYEIEYRDDGIVYDEYASKYGLDILDYTTTPFRNTYLMFYGIERVFNLTKDNQYDYYIRCRPDLLFHNDIDLNYIMSSLRANNKDMWVPHCYDTDGWEDIHNDQFAVCNLKSFKTYANIANQLKKLVDQTDSFYPEGLLAAAIKNDNIKVERGTIKMSLLRKCMLVTHPRRTIIPE